MSTASRLLISTLLLSFAVPALAADLHGDPLPPGAVARLGTVRFRAASPITFTFLPDGKTVLTVDWAFTAQVWDLTTGTPLFRGVLAYLCDENEYLSEWQQIKRFAKYFACVLLQKDGTLG